MIKVNYEVYSTKWHIVRALDNLSNHSILSFDTETKGIYTKDERARARKLLNEEGSWKRDEKILIQQVAANNGLSFPSLTQTTHFIFGVEEDYSIILLCDQPGLELFIWEQIAELDSKLIVHNTLFDFKIMYHRIGKLPKDYEDSFILAKSLINHVNIWKCKTGLKDLMGDYYDPQWSLMDEYEPDQINNPRFLWYAAIDGAATIKLWNDMQGYMEDK